MKRMGMVIGIKRGADRRIQAHPRRGLAGGPRQDLGLQHPQLHDLPARAGEPAVRLFLNIMATTSRPMPPRWPLIR